MKNKRICWPVFIAMMTIFLFFSFCACAEGSHELTPNSLVNGKWRAFIEWYPTLAYSSGNNKLPRRQVIKAYAQAGETIYFGSSVSAAAYKSYASSESGVPSPETIEDIRVEFPDGSVHDYDVIKDGLGHIGITTDTAGTKITAIEDVGPSALVAGGYDAFSYTVPAGGEGIYSFYFYSPLASTTSTIRRIAANAASPWINEQQNQMQGVAAWDVTIANGTTRIPGRVYADYLCITMGSNDYGAQRFLEAKVYVLTQDGYIYRTDFNGINPDGFLFFGNNRGLLNLTNNTSAYHSTMYTNNNMTQLLGNIGFRLPGLPDTEQDFTYQIFLNEPDAALLRFLGRETPRAPSSVSSFSFNNNNPVLVGVGGDLTFTANNASSFQLEIMFNNDPNNVIYIASICRQGLNVYHWNGLDYYGNPAQPGTYTARLRMKAGEYHFPLVDAEACKDGMEIKLINQPSENPYRVFYDHSRITINGTDLRHDIGADAFSGSLKQLNGISSQKNASGVSEAMRWVNSVDSFEGYYVHNDANFYGGGLSNISGNGYGNLKLFDVWTWYSTEDYVYETPLVVTNTMPTPPPTGDDSVPGLWMSAGLASLACVALLAHAARKKRI